MNEQQERADFEAWAPTHHKLTNPGPLTRVDGAGRYFYGPVDACWKAWQARAALAAQGVPADLTKHLAEALRMATDRIADLLQGDDGQAFKEAERVLPHFNTLLNEYVCSLAATPAPAQFNPDWNKLEATQESLREHIEMVNKIQAAITNAGLTLIRTERGYEVRKFGLIEAQATPAPAQQAKALVEANAKMLKDLLGAPPAPPQAQQAAPLTDEQLRKALTRSERGHITDTVRAIAADTQRACAEAWGVKLAGIGASSGSAA
jgi:hypothetical protein